MPHVDGVEATRRLREAAETPPVLVLTTFEDDEILAGTLRAGRPAACSERAGRRPAARRPRSRHRRLLARPVGDRPRPGRLPGPHHPRAARNRRRRTHPTGARGATPSRRGIQQHRDRADPSPSARARSRLGEGTMKTHVGHLFAELDQRDQAGAVVLPSITAWSAGPAPLSRTEPLGRRATAAPAGFRDATFSRSSAAGFTLPASVPLRNVDREHRRAGSPREARPYDPPGDMSRSGGTTGTAS